jgi:hypothetical protein
MLVTNSFSFFLHLKKNSYQQQQPQINDEFSKSSTNSNIKAASIYQPPVVSNLPKSNTEMALLSSIYPMTSPNKSSSSTSSSLINNKQNPMSKLNNNEFSNKYNLQQMPLNQQQQQQHSNLYTNIKKVRRLEAIKLFIL